MKLEIECFLEKLPTEEIEIKHILALKYIDRVSESEIASKLGYERRTIGKKIDRFLIKHVQED